MNKEKQIEEMAKDLCKHSLTEYCASGRCQNPNCLVNVKALETLCAKGYRKSADVAREIFAEIEKLMNEVYSSVQYGCYSYGTTKDHDSPSAIRQCGKLEGVKYLGDKIAELKKKYTEEGK